MKIRSSFVANSSSSSSVFITTEEEHNRVLSLLTEFEKAVIEKYVNKSEFAGLNLYYIEDWNDSNSNSYEWESLDELRHLITDKDDPLETKDSYIIFDIIDKYQGLIDKKKYLQFHQDW